VNSRMMCVLSVMNKNVLVKLRKKRWLCVCVSSTRLDKVTDCQLLVLYELSKARSRALLHIISSRLGAGQSGA
jgi:hypothetical protein